MTRPLLTRDLLRAEQTQIVDLIKRTPALLIDLKMGAGKTVACLTAALDMLDRCEIRRVLIIAPLRVARDTWPAEIEDWAHTRLLSVAVAVGDAKQRAAAVAAGAEITVTNFDNLPWLVDHVGGPRGWHWDALIVDESSQFKAGKKRTSTVKVHTTTVVPLPVTYGQPIDIPEKHRESALLSGRRGEDGPELMLRASPEGWITFDRPHGAPATEEVHVAFRKTTVRKGGNVTRFGALAKVRKRIRRVIEITGTPCPNGVHDLWGQIYLLDQGERLGSSMTAFEERWFKKDAYTYQVTPLPHAEAEIRSRITDVMFSFPPPADLPEPRMIPVPVTLPAKALAEYQRFKQTLVSEIHDVEAVSRGVLTQKLLQFANGSMYRADGSLAQVHTAKLDALDELLKDAAGDPMLILYGFKFDLAQIRKRHPDAVLLSESDTAVKDWNAGRIKKLLAHPASCAHGLNLQHGGHLGAWFGLTWSLELYLQANARLARPGQKWPVAMYQIIAEGTDDRRVLEVLDSRNATQEDFTRAVRDAIANQ